MNWPMTEAEAWAEFHSQPRDSQRQRVYDSENEALGAQNGALDRWTDYKDLGIVTPLRERPSLGRGSFRGKVGPDGNSIAWFKILNRDRWRPWALPTVADCQAYVDAVCEAEGVPTHRITDGRRARSASALWDGSIRLPRWARTRPVILHELAHHLRPSGTAGHGPEFCRVYLVLLARYYSEEGAQAVERAFQQHKVKIA